MTGREKFLILGSNSFSGATFADFLASLGYDVLATSRSPEPHEAFLPYKWHKHPGSVRFQRIDINHDLDALDVLIQRERPTHIVNFAAQSMVGESWLHPDDWMMTNVVSTVRLHERLRKHDFMERYVHVTTPEVYGSTDSWIREDAPFNPTSPYAVSRAAGDMSLRTYFAQYEFPVVFTRAANVYGPGQQLYRVIPRTILAATGGPKIRLDGGGKSVRAFIHMTDVCAATFKVATDGKLGDTYHISGYELVSIRTLIEIILKWFDRSFEDCVEIAPERPGKDTAYLLDSFKLRSELGWRDKISLEQGIDETIGWEMRFADVLAKMPVKYEHRP